MEIKTNGSIYPAAHIELSKYPDTPPYPIKGSYLRPIPAEYTRSILSVIQSFSEVLSAYSVAVSIYPDYATKMGWVDLISTGVHNLYQKLMTHLDDCENIIDVWTEPKQRPSKTKERYGKSIRDVRTHIASVANALKHKGGSVTSFLQFDTVAPIAIPGFFITSVDANGVIEPLRSIHPEYRGQATAMSLNWTLPYLLYCIYAISEHLAIAVKELNPTSILPSIKPLNGIEAVVRQIAQLPKQYFQDERFEKEKPLLKLLPSPTDLRELSISYPPIDEVILEPLPQKTYAAGIFMGDGYSTQFRVPYMGGPSESSN